MSTPSIWSFSGSSAGRLRQLFAVSVTTALLGLLAALPTAPAAASSPSITALSPVSVETLLAETPLSKLNTSQLADALSGLPGFGSVSPLALQEALSKTIATLSGKGDTLGNLLEANDVVPTLSANLKEVLGGPLSLLEGLLGGSPTTKLTEALGSASGTELLGELLSSSSEPAKLIATILAALSPEKLEGLLGSTLSGEPFSQSTVSGLASELETTPQTLVGDFGKTLPELPETAMALTAPLSSGVELGILDGVKGLVLGLLERGTGSVTEGLGGPGGAGGSGGAAGGTSSPGSTTVVVQEQGPQTQPITGTGPKASVAAAKVKILSHRVKGRQATIVVQVPSAGKLALGGKGVRTVHQESAKAERVTLKAVLTKAGSASLRKHHHHLEVTIKVGFKQTGGPSSAATVAVAFK